MIDSIVKAIKGLDSNLKSNWLKGGRPDLDVLREVMENDEITGEQRDAAFLLFKNPPAAQSQKTSKKTVLRANTDCRVKKGEIQTCWGSQFVATEIDNPDLDEEFSDEDAPKKILALIGTFKPSSHEVESLLKSRRASRT